MPRIWQILVKYMKTLMEKEIETDPFLLPTDPDNVTHHMRRLEEVVGEIQDPFDKEEASIKILEDNSIMADASISIYDLEEESEIEYPEPEDRDFDTLGGLILELVGDIPKIDDSVDFQNRTYTVKSLSGNRINKVHISVEHLQEMDEVQND